jgi:hypothetical protein
MRNSWDFAVDRLEMMQNKKIVNSRFTEKYDFFDNFPFIGYFPTTPIGIRNTLSSSLAIAPSEVHVT